MFSYIRSFFTTTEKKEETVDPFKEDYTGSSSQRKEINEKIKEFETINQLLIKSCNTISVVGGSGLLFFAWGLIPASLVLGMYYAFGNFNNPTEVRVQSHQFQEKLKELLKIYQWMTKSGVAVTNDVLTINLLELIAKYIVQLDDLIPANFIQNAKEVNPDFFSSLENTPHALPPKVIQLIYSDNNAIKEKKSPEETGTWDRYAPPLLKSTPCQTACQHIKYGVSQMLFGYDSKAEKKPDPKKETQPDEKLKRAYRYL